jgi:hypothetical protein
MSLAIIIPTLGRDLENLKATLKSINETGIDPLIIIVGLELSEKLIMIAEQNGAVLMQDNGLGLYAAINQGVRGSLSTSTHYTFLGDDDTLDPQGFRHSYEIAVESKSDVCYGGIRYVDDQGKILFINPSYPYIAQLLNWIPNLIPHPGSIIRIDTWLNLNGYNESYKLSSDLDFWIRAKKIGKFEYINRILANFRFSQETLSGGQRSLSIEEAQKIRRNHVTKWLVPIHIFWNPLQQMIGEAVLRNKINKSGKKLNSKNEKTTEAR